MSNTIYTCNDCGRDYNHKHQFNNHVKNKKECPVCQTEFCPLPTKETTHPKKYCSEECKNKQIKINEEKRIDKAFQKNSKAKTNHLKYLMVEYLGYEYKCVFCGLENEWNGKELILQLDHIDGDPTNNCIDNLRLLCPNCHTQTETHSCQLKCDVIVSDNEWIEAIKRNDSISNTIRDVGKRVSSHNAKKIKKLMKQENLSFPKVEITNEQLRQSIKSNTSIRAVLLDVGMTNAEGNYLRIRKLMNQENLEFMEIPENYSVLEVMQYLGMSISGQSRNRIKRIKEKFGLEFRK